MPTKTKKNTAAAKPVAAVVKNRSAAIRKSHQNQATVEDSRDVERGLPPVVAPTTTSLDISRAPERGKALELAQQLTSVTVTDLASQRQAKELLGVGKQIRKQITEHWQRITRSVDALKQQMFRFRDEDLEALEAGMAAAEKVVIEYENAENDRVRREEDRRREERERKALEERNRDLDAAEDKALELEQQSANLSARELWFVNQVVEKDLSVVAPPPDHLRAMMAICKEAGYKDTDNQVARLLRTQKVIDAIKGQRDAVAIREQAAAQRSQPLNIVDAAPVEANIARGRGLPPTKTYYSCEVLDANKLRDAFLNGELPAEALIPNEVYLNAQARAAKSAEIFERAFPGCRLKTRQSI